VKVSKKSGHIQIVVIALIFAIVMVIVLEMTRRRSLLTSKQAFL